MKTSILLTTAVLVALVVYATHYDISANATSESTASKQTTQIKPNFEDLAKDPKFVKNMVEFMKKNHPFTQEVVTSMLKDPSLRLQIIGHISENKDAMNQINEMMNQDASRSGKVKMDHSKMSDNLKKMEPGTKTNSSMKTTAK